MPSLMKSQPKEFGEELLNILNSDNAIDDFGFIKDSWRVSAYSQLNESLKEKNLTINYIIQAPYKDTIQLIRSGNKLTADLYYDGDGFFSKISALSSTETSLWTDFQIIINHLKTVMDSNTVFELRKEAKNLSGNEKLNKLNNALEIAKKLYSDELFDAWILKAYAGCS